MPDSPTPDLGQLAYTAYGHATGGVTYDSRPLPAFTELGDTIAGAWRAAAAAVAEVVVARYDDLGDSISGGSPGAVPVVGTASVAVSPDAGELLEAAPRQPGLGLVVLVLVDPTRNNGSPVAVATITRTWSGTSVNVKVTYDSGEPDEWRTSLIYVDSLDDVADDDTARLYRWSWPTRD